MSFELNNFLKGLLNGDFGIEVKEVRGQEKSGVVYLPMSYIGKKIIVIIKNEE